MTLRAQDLSFSYGEEPVLQKIDFSASPGELIGIVGPNGGGKSTLLKCLAGILHYEGQVFYEGEALRTLSERERAFHRAYLAQSLVGDFNFSVEHVVAMGLAHKSSTYRTPTSHPDILAALGELELSCFATDPVQNLSGGERQRVLLARTFVQGSPIMLLDEPTSALDLKHQKRWLESVRERAAKGTLFCVVLHDLNLALRACSRWLVIQNGKIAADGEPSDIVKSGKLDDVFETRLAVTTHPKDGKPLVAL